MDNKNRNHFFKRAFSTALAGLMAASLLSGAVFADDETWEEAVEAEWEESAEAEEAPAEETAPVETVVSNVIETNHIEGWPKASAKESDYLCLYEPATGTVLIGKNMDSAASPAALVKIMTTLTAIENGNLDDVVAMTQAGVDLAVAGSANLYTVLGESFTLKDMLYGVMLASANDMAVQVAEYVGGGSVDNFVAMMNERAAAIGCTNTHFVNPTGMTADGQVTTAHDMALICAAALENPTFKEIVSTFIYTIPATAIYAPRDLTNNFPCMEDPGNFGINGVFGGKTGYTDAAQNCIAAFCERDGRTQICVALHANDISKSVKDARKSFQYGYNKWTLRKAKTAKNEEKTAGGRVVTPLDKKVKDLDVTEIVSENGDGRDLVVKTYLVGGVQVGSITLLRAKPTPEPTPIVTEAPPQPETQTAPETQTSPETQTAPGIQTAPVPGSDAALGQATSELQAAAAASTGDAAAGTAAAPALDGTGAAAQTDAAAQAGVAAQTDAAAGTTGAAVGTAAAGQAAVEANAAPRVVLPFGVTMHRGSFIAIAVLSLLILLGIILILLTAMFHRHDE